jgi:hypothetical protein
MPLQTEGKTHVANLLNSSPFLLQGIKIFSLLGRVAPSRWLRFLYFSLKNSFYCKTFDTASPEEPEPKLERKTYRTSH